ncbi:hypothetical protein LX64_03061 [Chitinophaga skermanii]|uniref:Uncharacterized protein n=1 Tax=Chitinophaga skermanii TaxID=331697 RepID=A0A327QLG0_9BACT|nr:hypothetical protein [Chitinophaga skermanii]RAJ04183.1 hypothetical protein LX64_03061 [Chitinophaga skermanii]
MRIPFILAGLVMFAITARAQKFEKGYVIKANGDSIAGFIEKPNAKLTPSTIQFKSTEAGNTQTFTPKDIKKFKYDSNKAYFVSATLKLDLTTQDPEKLSRIAIESRDVRTDAVFLELVQDGRLKLYKYLYGDEYVYYIIEDQAGVFTGMENAHVYVERSNGFSGVGVSTTNVKIIPVYKDQLELMFTECVTKADIRKLSYTESAFKKFLVNFQVCRYGDDVKKLIVAY